MQQERPVIDLRRVTFFEPFALIYLGMFLRFHNAEGKYFDVAMPTDPMARGYLAGQNFWNRFNFANEVVREERLRRLTNTTSLNDIVDIERTPYIAEEVAEAVLRILRNSAIRVQASRIAELVSELVDNFAQHSERVLAACALQYYPAGRRVVFAIGDCGLGIRASLSSNSKYASLKTASHHEAIVKAFEPLVSRKAEGGMGLTEVREGVVDLNGRLFLSSGDAYAMIDAQQATIGDMGYELPGVQVELSFPEGWR